MLELYAFVSLLGLGYLFGYKTQAPAGNHRTPINVNELPSQNNMYDSSYQQEVMKREEAAARRAYAKSRNTESTGVVPRHYRDVRDAQQKEQTVKSSLAGIEIPTHDFERNNMGVKLTPFFGSRVTQNVDPIANRSVLETFTGEFSPEIYRKKKEQRPIFDPMQRNLGNDITGNKARTEFYQERIVAPRARNNERPFEPQRVGPGLNKGYTAKPDGGFQAFDVQGYAMPKTVDELRIGSNPKETHEGRILPGKGMSSRGQPGALQKNKNVVTFYENNPDRYFRTTGAFTKESQRPIFEAKEQNRASTTKEYAGDPHAAGFSKGQTVDSAVTAINRQQLEEFGFRNVDGEVYGKGDAHDYGKSTILCAENERDHTVEKTYEGNIGSLVKAIIAPLEDIFRTTRREFDVQNPRLYGQLQATFPMKITIKDPNDVMRTTIKETTIHDTVNGNLVGPKQITVYDSDVVAKTTIRQTTKPTDTELNLAGSTKQTLPTSDTQRTTLKQTTIDGQRYGNMNSLERTNQGYLTTEFDAPITQKQFTSDNDYTGIADKAQADGYLVANPDMKTTQKQFLSDNDYVGGAGTTDAKKPMSKEDYLNASINELKETTLEGREPTQESVKVPSGAEGVNQTTRRLEIDEYVEREHNNIERVYGHEPVCPEGKSYNTKEKDSLDNDDRLDINILDSLGTNPYALKPFNKGFDRA
jgi:hypothetical protein